MCFRGCGGRGLLNFVSHLLTALVAALHCAFAYIEAVAWEDQRVVERLSGGSAASAAETRVLARNQGFYNLCVALGLLYGTFHGVLALVVALRRVAKVSSYASFSSTMGLGSRGGSLGAREHRSELVARHVQLAFLLFVVAASAVGAATVSVTIAYVQGGPAVLAAIAVLLRVAAPHPALRDDLSGAPTYYDDVIENF